MKVVFWRCFTTVVGALLVSACDGTLKYYTSPIGEDDILPNGTVSEIQANPKRNANKSEIEAIQRAVRTNPLLSGEQVVSNVRVEAVSKPVLGFCGHLEGGAAASADATPVVTGALRTVEGQLLAYDLRYGEQAQLRCNYMEFWPDSEQ